MLKDTLLFAGQYGLSFHTEEKLLCQVHTFI